LFTVIKTYTLELRLEVAQMLLIVVALNSIRGFSLPSLTLLANRFKPPTPRLGTSALDASAGEVLSALAAEGLRIRVCED